MRVKRFFILGLTFTIISACSQGNSEERNVEPPNPCTFSNPVAAGQDPWVTKKGDTYYYIESSDGGLYVSKSQDLTDIKSNAVKVWSVPDSGWNQANVWAPELHYINGKWYIYYTAGESGPPFIHQRSGVLESKTDDALGGYVDRGQLYTGDKIGRAIRTDRYRLVEWKQIGADPETADIELYDYSDGPVETINLANEQPKVVERLKKILYRYPEAHLVRPPSPRR